MSSSREGVPLVPGPGNLVLAPAGHDPTPHGHHDDDDGPDLRRYAEALRKRIWLVILCVVVAGAGVFGWTIRQPKLYRATGTVIIDTRTANVLSGVADVVEMGAGTYWANEAFYQREYTVMRSRAVARRAAEKLGLLHDDQRNGLATILDPEEREEKRKTLDPADLADGRYTIESGKSGNIVHISVVDTDPQFAADFVNAVADAYAELNIEKRVEGTLEASTWLQLQHQELGGDLEKAEKALYDFMANNGVLNASLSSQLEEVTQRLRAFNAELAEVQAERIRQELDAQALREVRANKALIDSIPEVRDAPVISALKTRMVELQAKRSELASRYQPAHPQMQTIDEQIGLVENSLAAEIDSVLLSLERKQASLESTEVGLKKAVEAERAKEARLNKLSFDYERLKREVDTNTKLYNLVATRQKEADLTGALKLNNVIVLDRAKAPLAPFKPSLRNNLVLGLLAGLFLGALIAIWLEVLDSSIKTQEDVESVLRTPFLGLMPIIEAPAASKARAGEQKVTQDRDLYVLRNPKSAPAECARFIRTNLLFMSPDKPLRTLVITSAGPQEGKTTTAISLAVTMAQSGSRTLIVDTDMRRPRLHRAFGVSNDVGLSSVIVGEAKLEDAIQATDGPGLDVLVCGPIPPNPAELLHTASFKDIVSRLREKYDRVLFDSPPVGAVTDPLVLGNLTDGAVMVLKAMSTSRESARASLRSLRDANVPVLGAVLNDVDLQSRRYGGGYYAYYRQYGAYYGEAPSEAASGA